MARERTISIPDALPAPLPFAGPPALPSAMLPPVKRQATDRDGEWEPRKYAVEAAGGVYMRAIYFVECAAVARYAYRRDQGIRSDIKITVTPLED
jgi:hypothetical protein